MIQSGTAGALGLSQILQPPDIRMQPLAEWQSLDLKRAQLGQSLLCRPTVQQHPDSWVFSGLQIVSNGRRVSGPGTEYVLQFSSTFFQESCLHGISPDFPAEVQQITLYAIIDLPNGSRSPRPHFAQHLRPD